MSALSPLAFNPFRERTRDPFGSGDLERNPVYTQDPLHTQHGRDASGRSLVSTVSERLASARERDRQTTRNAQATRNMQRTNHATAAAENGFSARIMRTLNLRQSNTAQGEATNVVPVMNGGAAHDMEAHAGRAGTQGNQGNQATSRGKSRREKEEGATLFGPNLANYFGSSSSSSGAVFGTTQNSMAPAVAATETASNSNTLARRPRLGSRGRARGASLSGLSQWSVNMDGNDSASLLPDNTSMKEGDGLMASTSPMPMLEGIEVSTLRRWIERSTVGGAMEISRADDTQAIHGHAGNPGTLCSTLQSYVNLKRNTVRLNAIAPEEHDPSSNVSHSLQFEYDCAAPNASIQVFVRASRKHGSWVAWSAARDAMGLSTDLSAEAKQPNGALQFGHRGPPPHALGWPVHSCHVRRGFGAPLSLQVALQLDLYAPPRNKLEFKEEGAKAATEADADMAKRTDTSVPIPTSTSTTAPTAALTSTSTSGPTHTPETPGISGPTPVHAPETPGAAHVPDTPGVEASRTGGDVFSLDREGEESKEAKLAREKSERETIKVSIIVEALDEDMKPLKEPNLQTTYLRLASMPARSAEHVELDQSLGQAPDTVVDIAMPTSLGEDDNKAKAPASTKRAWTIQVEGQEAEIGPHRFQLHELYGLSTRPPPRTQQVGHQPNETEATDTAGDEEGMPSLGLDADDQNTSECLICLSAPPSTLLLPCTHGLCLDCAIQLRDTVQATRETERRRGRRPKRKYACPVCRRVYTNMLHLSAVDEKWLAQASAGDKQEHVQ